MDRNKVDATEDLGVLACGALTGKEIKPWTISKEKLSNAAVLHVQATTTFWIGVVFVALAFSESVFWLPGLSLIGYAGVLVILQRHAAKGGN